MCHSTASSSRAPSSLFIERWTAHREFLRRERPLSRYRPENLRTHPADTKRLQRRMRLSGRSPRRNPPFHSTLSGRFCDDHGWTRPCEGKYSIAQFVEVESRLSPNRRACSGPVAPPPDHSIKMTFGSHGVVTVPNPSPFTTSWSDLKSPSPSSAIGQPWKASGLQSRAPCEDFHHTRVSEIPRRPRVP
jgi:hypothetical protein